MPAQDQQLDDLKQQLHRLSHAVVRLKESIEVFEGFYRASDTPLLGQLPVGVDTFFLPIVRDAFTDSIVMQIASLMDRTKQTLSVERFLVQMAKRNLPTTSFKKRLREVRSDAESVIEVRNNLVAHANQAVALRGEKLQKVTFQQAKTVTNDLVTLISELHEVIHGSVPDPLPSNNEGSDAVRFLADCIELRQRELRAPAFRFLSAR